MQKFCRSHMEYDFSNSQGNFLTLPGVLTLFRGNQFSHFYVVPLRNTIHFTFLYKLEKTTFLNSRSIALKNSKFLVPTPPFQRANPTKETLYVLQSKHRQKRILLHPPPGSNRGPLAWQDNTLPMRHGGNNTE